MGTLALYKLMKHIKQRKFKVTISGEGSDELNLGYFNQQLAYHISEKEKYPKYYHQFCKFNKISNNVKNFKKYFFT